MPIEEGRTYNVTIQDTAHPGDGISRLEGFVVFVPNTSVGNGVQIEVEN